MEIDNKEGPANYNISFSYENLRVYPILANDNFLTSHKDIGNFTILKDAIEKKKILITETGAGAGAETQQDTETIVERPNENEINEQLENNQLQNNQIIQSNYLSGDVSGTVNTLIAKNISTDTIFIMAGEVVKGGKQDRVIGQDVVIAPGEEMDLSAFCVEKNRWVTKDKNEGAFTDYYNVTSMDIRKSVTEEKNQSEVWKKVDQHTSKNKASSSTSTYTNLENSDDYQKDVKNYMETFSSPFKNNNKIIGFIAVTGDQIIGCDMFATHELFISSYENLIHSYIGHAITNGSNITISNEKVFSYLHNILKNESKQEEKIEKNGTLYKWNNKKITHYNLLINK
jgi:hypothetical protein